MKRLSSSDSLIPICPTDEAKGMYERGFQPMIDGLDEECGDVEPYSASGGGEKKRRLSVDQVRALEKNFEVDNKLEPDRKVRLAQELGLHPRQVAIWFQNRRARWKTKQLERDYAALKGSYEALRVDFDVLYQDKEALLAEMKMLKEKLAEEESASFSYVKREPLVKESQDHKASEEPPAQVYKDGSSDSDSSAVVNDENSPHDCRMSSPMFSAPIGFENSTSNLPCSPPSLLNSDSRQQKGGFFFHHQLSKMEDNGFLTGEEPCSSFFSDDHVATLNWYYSEHWT